VASEFKLAILAFVTMGLALSTWRSLRGFRSHGTYRLLTWMAASALILLNLDYWFDEPFCIRQLTSWFLLLISLIIVIFGSISLQTGRPGRKRQDPSLIGIERTTQLVTTGAYRYIRHPMYSSVLFGACGVLLKRISFSSALLAGVAILLAVVTARVEEAENITYFGNAYKNYMKRTKRFIPFLF
jgi:protein-S-isoprenylcysteine O-methyltransferase Ste14